MEIVTGPSDMQIRSDSNGLHATFWNIDRLKITGFFVLGVIHIHGGNGKIQRN